MVWILVEGRIAIVVACFPICLPIIRKALRKSTRSFHENSRDSDEEQNHRVPFQDDQIQLVESTRMHTSDTFAKGNSGIMRSDAKVDASTE